MVQFFRVISRRFGRVLTGAAYKVDHWVRKADGFVNRSHGGLTTIVGAEDYPPFTLLIVFPILYLVVFGPTPPRNRGALAFEIWLGSSVVWAIVIRLLSRWAWVRDRLLQIGAGIILVAAVLTWDFAKGDSNEASNSLYSHILIFLLAGLAVFLAVVPPFFAQWLMQTFHRLQGEYLRALFEKELFVKPVTPRIRFLGFLRSLLVTPIQFPLQVLVFPAIAVILVPEDWMYWAGGGVLIVTLAAASLGGVHERLQAMWMLIYRAIAYGAQRIVSFVIVLLAAARLADISYISIPLNSAEVTLIAAWIATAYSCLWFYEWWLTYQLCAAMLPILGGPKKSTAIVDYSIDPSAIKTEVLRDSRHIEIHGSRFAATGKYQLPSGKSGHAWESYEKVWLLEVIAKASPTQNMDEAFRISDLRQRVRFYYAMIHVTVAAVLGCTAWWLHTRGQVPGNSPNAQMAKPQKAPAFRGLRAELLKTPRRDKIVLVAASGGGTRAAIYSASLLRGLHELGRLGDVACVSSVSGGSAANAYFVAHRDELIQPNNGSAWDDFLAAMAASYIDDVLRGSTETRIVNDTRLGTLLAESLDRRIAPGATASAVQDSGIGVIFNTTLAGKRSWDSGSNDWGPATALVAGERLVITNLESQLSFGSDLVGGIRKELLEAVAIRDSEISLAQAAALSANFPPVFSDAGIEYEGPPKKWYWATDGGAADNRGIISLLYALRGAISKMEAEERASLPEIHIIVADASALNMDFKQDRGTGAITGAADQGVNQLMAELLEEVREMIDGQDEKRADEKVQFHLVSMPPLFCSRGGIGTHWMLASSIDVEDPKAEEKAEKVTLYRREVLSLVSDLHLPLNKRHYRKPEDERAALQKVVGWLTDDDHAKAWERCRQALLKKPTK